MIERLELAAEHGRRERGALWRFMDFTKYVAMLHERSLFFSRADLLPDPFEGYRPSGCERGARDEERDEHADLRRRVCLSCWHENEHESAAMWRIYLHSRDGLAICSSTGALEAALAHVHEPLYLGSVRYVDYRRDQPRDDELAPFFLKRQSYDYEREVRVLWRADRPLDTPGQYLRADLTKLIEQVVISPNAAPWFEELVRSVTEKYGLQLPIGRSSLLEPPGR